MTKIESGAIDDRDGCFFNRDWHHIADRWL